MSFYYSMEKETIQENQPTSEKKVFKLDVDLLALRAENPNTFVYMFLATTNAFGENVDSIHFIHGEEELPKFNAEKSEFALIHDIYPKNYQRPQGVQFLRPDIWVLSSFVQKNSKPLIVKAIKGEEILFVKEPVQISEDEYLNGGYQKIDEKDQVEINEEVNAIYKGWIAC